MPQQTQNSAFVTIGQDCVCENAIGNCDAEYMGNKINVSWRFPIRVQKGAESIENWFDVVCPGTTTEGPVSISGSHVQIVGHWVDDSSFEAYEARVMESAPTVSFDCTKAMKNVERLICFDTELSALDGRMADVYRRIAAVSPYKDRLKIEQRQWLKNHRNACANIECLRAVYQNRILALEAASAQMAASSSAQFSASTMASRTGAFMDELVAQMIRDGEVRRECVNESPGKMEKLFDVSPIDLNGDEHPELQITGQECACQGARRCMVWIYRRATDGRYERIFGASPADSITPQRIATNGYLDLVETGVSGNDVCASTHKFNGQRYQEVRGSLSCSPAD
jgi:uncharacterized protein